MNNYLIKSLAAAFLVITGNSVSAQNLELETLLQTSPTSVLVYAINPYDCPACLLGYSVARQKLEPHIADIIVVTPSTDTILIRDFLSDHLDSKILSNRIFVDDTYFNQLSMQRSSSVNLFNHGKSIWKYSLKDLPQALACSGLPDSVAVQRVQQTDISKFYKDAHDRFFRISDSTIAQYQYLSGQVLLLNVRSGTVINSLASKDSLLLESLIAGAIVEDSIINYNQSFLRQPLSSKEKYGLPPVTFRGFYFDGFNLWVGGMYYLAKREQKNGEENVGFYLNSFLLKLNTKLEITRIFHFPFFESGTSVCPMAVYFAVFDSTLITMNSTMNLDSLISIYTLTQHAQPRLTKLFDYEYPSYKPTQIDGKRKMYGIYFCQGFQGNVLFYLADDTVAYDTTDSCTHQAFGFSKELLERAGIINLRGVLTVPDRVVIFSEARNNTLLYSVVSKPHTQAMNAFALDDGLQSTQQISKNLFQSITKTGDGKYFLNIYKIF